MCFKTCKIRVSVLLAVRSYIDGYAHFFFCKCYNYCSFMNSEPDTINTKERGGEKGERREKKID
jgi:hypothetical protein